MMFASDALRKTRDGFKIFAIAALAVAFQALTADRARAAEPVKASWTGGYVQVHAGLAATSTEVDGMLSLSGDGTQLGIAAGFDLQMGRAVAGVWSEYTWADIQTSFGGANVALEGSVAAGGRVGLLLNDRLLAYVLAGWTQVDASANFASMPKFDGYVLGGGVEALVGDSFSLKLEYRGTMLNSEDVQGVGFEPDSHAVRVGGAWRFNFPSLK